MTASLPPRPPGWTEVAADGCRVCRTQATSTVDGINGRRCAAHPPQFSRAVVTRLLVDGWPHTALAYCRTFPEDATPPMPAPRLPLDRRRCGLHPGRENHCISGECGECWLCASDRPTPVTTTAAEA